VVLFSELAGFPIEIVEVCLERVLVVDEKESGTRTPIALRGSQLVFMCRGSAAHKEV
jgi:hypothetical protein